MPKSAFLKSCMKTLWCFVIFLFYNIFLYKYYIQSNILHPNIFFVTSWLLERRKNNGFFMIIAYIYIIFLELEKVPKSAKKSLALFFLPKNAMKVSKNAKFAFFGTKNASWQPWGRVVPPRSREIGLSLTHFSEELLADRVLRTRGGGLLAAPHFLALDCANEYEKNMPCIFRIYSNLNTL